MGAAPLCNRDLAVHQHGQEPVAELGQMMVFHAARKDHLVMGQNGTGTKGDLIFKVLENPQKICDIPGLKNFAWRKPSTGIDFPSTPQSLSAPTR
jgi:hypothetical protein